MSGSVRQDNQDPALFGQTPWQTVGSVLPLRTRRGGVAPISSERPISVRAPELFAEPIIT